MLGGTALSTVLGAVGSPDGETPLLSHYVRELAKTGLLPVFLDDDLTPCDPRPARTAKISPVSDNIELATDKVVVLQRYWKFIRKEDPFAPMRIGVDLLASHYAVVACGTPEARAAFCARTASAHLIAPTMIGADGTSFYWFAVPPAVMVRRLHTDRGGWTLRGSGVGLIPPTAGLVVHGREWPAPPWLCRLLAGATV